VGYGIETDLRYVKAIREAIGKDLYLMVDANHAYNASEAIRLARAMNPTTCTGSRACAAGRFGRLHRSQAEVQILIAGGECEYTRYGFRELINRRAWIFSSRISAPWAGSARC